MSVRPFADKNDFELCDIIEEGSTRELRDALVTPHLDAFDSALDAVVAYANRLEAGTVADDLRHAAAEFRLRAHSEAP